MHALLVQQGLFKKMKGVDNLHKEMNDEEKKDFMNGHILLFNFVCLIRLWERLLRRLQLLDYG